MKKFFVYVTFYSVFYLLQACNNNSASGKNATSDTIAAGSTNSDTTTSQDINDTSTKKKAVHINSNEVPNAVITAFNSKYSNITDEKWLKADNKRGKIIYRARWQANGKKMMAAFSDDGTFIKEKELN